MGKFDRKPKQPAQVTEQTPTFKTLNFHTSVFGPNGPINDAHVYIKVDSERGEFDGVRVNENGYYNVVVPSGIPKPYGADLTVIAPGFSPNTVRVTLWNDTDYDLNGGIKLEPDFPFAAETGRITVGGPHFWNNGDYWFMRGATMFMLFARYLRGEDVRPQFNWLRKHGFNTARVLGPVDWPEWPDYQGLFDWIKLDEFFTLAHNHGIRILWVPITTRANGANHLTLLRESINVANRHENVIIQVCNEPLKDGKCDPEALLHSLNLINNSLTDYGIYFVDSWPSDWPIHDFGSVHLTREYPKFTRKSKDLLELRNQFNKPFISDEPIGVAEAAVSGRRTDHVDAVVDDAAVSLLCGNGYVLHTEYGIQGLVPPAGSIQNACAEDLCTLFQFIPDYAHAGSYLAPHIAGFPLKWEDADSEVGHAYAMQYGNKAWAVNPMPREGWVPVGVNGWNVVHAFLGSVVYLER